MRMIIFCFLKSLRIGSYGVTTRPRDKWITIDYAHRTEINSVTIVKGASKSRTGEREKERRAGKRRKKVRLLLIPVASSAASELKTGKG